MKVKVIPCKPKTGNYNVPCALCHGEKLIHVPTGWRACPVCDMVGFVHHRLPGWWVHLCWWWRTNVLPAWARTRRLM